MTKNKKICVVLLTLIVVFSAFACPVFASNSIPDYSDVLLTKTLFSPVSITLGGNNSDYAYLEVSTDMLLDSHDVRTPIGREVTYVQKAGDVNTNDVTVYTDTYFVQDILSAYGLDFYSLRSRTQILNYMRDAVNSPLTIRFNDLFLNSEMLRGTVTMTWFSNWNLTDGYNVPISFYDCSVFFTAVYFDPDTNSVVKRNFVYNAIDHTDLSADNVFSHMGLRYVKDLILEYISPEARAYGVLIQDLEMRSMSAYIEDHLELTTINKFVSEDTPLGYEAALLSWSNGFVSGPDVDPGPDPNPDPPVSVDSSIVGELTRGVEAIWQFNLFGEFTIGQLFTACVGLSLFIWLLKIFAGG